MKQIRRDFLKTGALATLPALPALWPMLARAQAPQGTAQKVVRYADFGNRHSPFGWELDYILSRALGGASCVENLQALHWKAGAARSETLPQALMTTTESKAAA